MNASKRPFVLSGGGARGYAHLGVLKAFAEQQVIPSAIAATRAGSIAAAFICDGYTTDEVREIFQHHKIGLSMEWRNWRTGLLSLKNRGEGVDTNPAPQVLRRPGNTFIYSGYRFQQGKPDDL